MSLFTFFKLCRKAIRFAVARPLQRFNIENRSKKYLGPEARYFKPAPRAIGAMSLIDGKPPVYPYLEASGGGGFKSIKQRRLEAIASKRDQLLESQKNLEPVVKLKSYSETEIDDNFVRSVANQLEVTKRILSINAPESHPALPEPNVVNTIEEENDDPKESSLAQTTKAPRPLPTSTNLDLQNQLSIWAIDKTPPGRLDINMLQELMINKLADEAYWTPERIAERYNIKEEYAEQLIKYCKQVTIVVSPKVKNMLDYTGRENTVYQLAKDVVYKVDKGLRDQTDKIYDSMYLPEDQLPSEVRDILDPPGTVLTVEDEKAKLAELRKGFVTKRPAPLRLNPINQESNQKRAQPRLIEPKKEEDGHT